MPYTTQYLGHVERVRGTEHAVVDLKVICERTPDDTAWLPVAADDALQARFPNRGVVAWFNAPDWVQEGLPFGFSAEESETYVQDNPHHARFRVNGTPIALTELLTVADGDDLDAGRLAATVNGIPIRQLPFGDCYLQVAHRQYIGPVALVHGPGAGTAILEPGKASKPLHLWRLPAGSAVVKLGAAGGTRTYLTPGTHLSPIGQLDWAPDSEVLKRVLDSIRKHDQQMFKDLELTSKAVRRLADRVAGGEPASTLEAHRLARAKRLIGSRVLEDRVICELIGLVKALPETEAAMASLRQQQRHDILAEEAEGCRARRAVFETELSAMRAQAEADLSTSRAAEAALRAKASELEEQVARLEGEAKSQAGRLQGAMDERLKAFMATPERALAEVAIFRAALGSPRSSEVALPSATWDARGEPWSVHTRGQVEWLTTAELVRRSVQSAYGEADPSSNVAVALHCAFASGAIPMLSGHGSRSALTMYADSITGGRALWVPIMAGLASPAGLIGKLDTGMQRIVPHPAGLADLLLEAAASRAPYLVILDGANLADMDLYLPHLLAAYSTAGADRPVRSLSVCHPSMLSPDDPYRECAAMAWPPNVLLAGLLNEGACGLTPGVAVWAGCAFLHTEGFDLPVAATPRRRRAEATPDALRQVSQPPSAAHGAADALAGLPLSFCEAIARFTAAAAAFGADDGNAQSMALRHLVAAPFGLGCIAAGACGSWSVSPEAQRTVALVRRTFAQ